MSIMPTNVLILGDTQGNVFFTKASGTYPIKQARFLYGNLTTSPVFRGNIAFCGESTSIGVSSLHAFDITTTDDLWSPGIQLNGSIDATPIINKNILYIAASNGYLYAYDISNLAQPVSLWQLNVLNLPSNTYKKISVNLLSMSGDQIYLVTEVGLYGIQLNSDNTQIATIIWASSTTTSFIESTPILNGKYLVVSSGDEVQGFDVTCPPKGGILPSLWGYNINRVLYTPMNIDCVHFVIGDDKGFFHIIEFTTGNQIGLLNIGLSNSASQNSFLYEGNYLSSITGNNQITTYKLSLGPIVPTYTQLWQIQESGVTFNPNSLLSVENSIYVLSSNGILYSYNIETGAFLGSQNINSISAVPFSSFTVPEIRNSNMECFPPLLYGLTNSSNKGHLIITNNNVITQSGSSNSYIWNFSLKNPNSVDEGYLLSYNGQYITKNISNGTLISSSQITDAIPFSINKTLDSSDNEYYFSEINSFDMLTVQENKVFFAPPQGLPSEKWTLQIAPPSQGLEEALNSTTYTKEIVNLINMDYSSTQRGNVWNYSFNATLPDDWLIATPPNVWGKTYSDFVMAREDPNNPPFDLQACTVNDPPTGLCLGLQSTVTAPGRIPNKLFVSHSYVLYETLYEAIINGQKFIDITTLYAPDGWILNALTNAITYVSNKPKNQRPIIRILFANMAPYIFKNSTPLSLLTTITQNVDPSKEMQIYVGVMRSSFSSWNHSKIIAVDGNYAIVGGHNMSTFQYLKSNPVFDVSMKLNGIAALHAQDFADRLWRYIIYLAPSLSKEISWAIQGASYKYDSVSHTNKLTDWDFPDVSLYESFRDTFPSLQEEAIMPVTGGIPVTSVGRVGDIEPTVYSNVSDVALLKMISLSQNTIRMSVHTLLFTVTMISPNVPFSTYIPRYTAGGWYEPLIKALGEALTRNVNIYIVLSNVDALAGGLEYADAQYYGNKIEEINQKMQTTLVNIFGKTVNQANQIITQYFHVAHIRYSTDERYPGVERYPGSNQIPNHAKTIIVDDTVFYIGSQNSYDSNLAEFGFIVESSKKTQEYLTQYWNPLWQQSLRTCTNNYNPGTIYNIKILGFKCITPANSDVDYISVQYNGITLPLGTNVYYALMEAGSNQNLGLNFNINSQDNPIIIRLIKNNWLLYQCLYEYNFHPTTKFLTLQSDGTTIEQNISDLVINQPYIIDGIGSDGISSYRLSFLLQS